MSKKETAPKTAKKVETPAYKDFVKAMESLNKTITKDKKDEVVIAPLSEMHAVDVECISSGSLILDNLAGGGFPKGRIIEIYGPEASGKTSIALNAIAHVQRQGGNALFIDAENAFDPNYAKILGVDVDRLGITQLSVAEQALHVIEQMIQTGTVDLIVVDTVASLIPKAEFEDPDKPTIGLLARIMSTRLKGIVAHANKHKCTVIFLNQVRDKVGVMFGNPETTPGGKALKFYASQRIKISRKGQYSEGSEVLGTEVRIKIEKNKIAPPFQTGTTILTFAKGINRPAEIVEVGCQLGAIEVAGRTHTFTTENPDKYSDKFEIMEGNKVKLGTSKKAVIDALAENEELFNEIAKSVETIMRHRREGASLEDALAAVKIYADDIDPDAVAEGTFSEDEDFE